MAMTFDERRRVFMRQMAQIGLAAGSLGWVPGAVFADEPQHCSGPKPPATPVKWTPDTNPILPRLAASTLATTDVDKLRKAYKALRALAQSDPNDPRGWLQQGDKHCWNCGGGLDGQAGEEIHGSWLFFPWHRAFLYFHERILGTLISDPSLRLAYWDWDNAAHRGVPPAWVTPNDASNPLFDANRSATATNQLPTWIVGPQVMNPIVNAPNFTTIGGSATNAGNLENGPHGGVHIWCGDVTTQSAKADMGLLDTAAQDPLFFAHHTNIDRLWDSWIKAGGTHKNPTSATWLKHKFTFWDEKKRWVSITVADVINMSTNLRYTYGTGAIAVPPHMTLAAPKRIPIPGDPIKGLVVPEALRTRLTAAQPESATKTFRTLQVEGITLPAGATGIYRIVANGEPAAGPPPENSPNELGYIAIVPRTSKGGTHSHGPLTVELDVTRQLPQLLREGGTLKLSYVPTADGGAKSNRLTHGNVYLVER